MAGQDSFRFDYMNVCPRCGGPIDYIHINLRKEEERLQKTQHTTRKPIEIIPRPTPFPPPDTHRSRTTEFERAYLRSSPLRHELRTATAAQHARQRFELALVRAYELHGRVDHVSGFRSAQGDTEPRLSTQDIYHPPESPTYVPPSPPIVETEYPPSPPSYKPPDTPAIKRTSSPSPSPLRSHHANRRRLSPPAPEILVPRPVHASRRARLEELRASFAYQPVEVPEAYAQDNEELPVLLIKGKDGKPLPALEYNADGSYTDESFYAKD